MKWIFDVEGGLLNLQHIEHITVQGKEGKEDEYEVLAIRPDGDAYTIYSSTEEKCWKSLHNLAFHLGLMKGQEDAERPKT